VSFSPPLPSLRPLGLGELLDRAVALCVNNFVPLSLIFLVYAIPLGLVQYFATKDVTSFLQVFTDAVGAQGSGAKAGDPTALQRALAAAPPLNGWYPLLIALVFFAGPLPTAALIEATSARYMNRSSGFAEAYGVALARWAPLLGINVLYLLAGAILYVAVVLGAVALALGLVYVTAALHWLGIAILVVIGVTVTVAGLAFFVVAALALQISYFTCVVEREGPVTSFGRGIRRVFVGVGLKRSLLVGVAFFAIAIAIGIVSAIGEAAIFAALRNTAVGAAYSTIVRIATAAFTTAFLAIFYFDLRVREEGLDLQLAAQAAQLQPPAQALAPE
jgi:hypothetical protein